MSSNDKEKSEQMSNLDESTKKFIREYIREHFEKRDEQLNARMTQLETQIADLGIKVKPVRFINTDKLPSYQAGGTTPSSDETLKIKPGKR